MMKNSGLALLILTLMMFSIVAAQATWIDGYVKDAEGNPIAGATIVAKGAFETSAVTDSKGYYKLGLSAGEWTITASYDKFEEAKTIILADGEHKVLDFTAATTVVHLYAPKPVIVDVPSSLKVEEGKSIDFEVEIRNDGTDGTVSIAVTCPIATFTTSETGFDMKASEVREIKCKAYGLNVEKDTTDQIEVFAQGRGGTDTKYIALTVENVEGWTPTVTPAPSPSPSSDYLWIVVIGVVVVLGIVLVLASRKRIAPVSEAKVKPLRKEAIPTARLPTVVEKEKRATCSVCGYNNPPYAVNYCVKCGARLK